jgi:hypothetical protein
MIRFTKKIFFTMFVASYEGCQQDDKYALTIIVKYTE